MNVMMTGNGVNGKRTEETERTFGNDVYTDTHKHTDTQTFDEWHLFYPKEFNLRDGNDCNSPLEGE